MNFASLQFAGFMGLVWVLNALMPSVRWQNTLLLAVSYYFYACWDARLLGLIAMVTAVTYGVGQVLTRPDLSATVRKRVLVASLMFSLLVLGTFKYYDFFAVSFAELMSGLGVQVRPWLLHWVLPAAISFYTFESISYVVGVYKRELVRHPTWMEYSLFIAFFPKLVAGPIERPNVLIPQLAHRRQVDAAMVWRGLFLILLGLAKKVAIADGLAPFVSSVYDSPAAHAPAEVLAATVAFAFQIYGDFSGYSDIARGCALLLGIELSWNFNVPYFSRDPSEFWRRWHISLSSWLRDYVYIPFGGNRHGEWKTYRNLFYTMVIGGLWHGAAWTFVAWGAFHGALLAVHKAMSPMLALTSAHESRAVRVAHDLLAWAGFFLLTCYGWLLFRATSMQQVIDMTQSLWLTDWSRYDLIAPPLSALLGVPLLVFHDAFAYRRGLHLPHETWPSWLRGGFQAALVVVILMGAANSRSAFIYFQF